MTPGTTHQRAVIFHGYGATPEDHWFGWLAEQLEAVGIPTTVPPLPHPLEPDPAQWEDTVRTAVGVPDENSIVIAHSLGCLTVLRYLRSLPAPWRLKILILVSGFLDHLPALPDLDDYIAEGCDIAGLRDHIGHLVVIHSDQDPFVPPALTDHLAKLLGVQPQVVPGAGHFVATDGMTALPQALKAITSATNRQEGGQ